MFVREVFAVADPAEVAEILASVRLGCLVTHDARGLCATHLPFLHDPARNIFAGHIARENDHWSRASETDALIVFQGADAYVSPNWYPSKSAHGRVVPTWNYEAVHVHGRLAWLSDPERLRTHLSALTDRFEAGHAKPWQASDAPDDYIAQMLARVVGVEVAVERVEVMRKLSQNRPAADRAGVVAGLAASAEPGDRAVAEKMRRLDWG
jgi:transcriptional regulator